MSRDMVGANCGTDNPMMQMVKHFTQDKAQMGQIGGRPQPGMGAGPMQMPSGPMGAQQGGMHFQDQSGLAADLEQMRMARARGAMPQGAMGAGWANEFQGQGHPMMMGGPGGGGGMEAAFAAGQTAAAGPDWAAEFQQGGGGGAAAMAAGPHAAAARGGVGMGGMGMGPMGMGGMGMMGGMGGMGMGMQQLPGMGGPQQQMQGPPPAAQKEWKKQLAKPDGWAEEFIQYDDRVEDAKTQEAGPADLAAEQSELQEAAAELIRQSDNPKFAQSKFMQFVKSIGAGDVTLDKAGKQFVQKDGSVYTPQTEMQERTQAGTYGGVTANGGDWAQDFESQVRDGTADPAMLADRWAEAFAQQMKDGTFGPNGMADNAWAQAVDPTHDTPDWAGEDGLEEQRGPLPAHGYQFEQENPYLQVPDISYDQAMVNANEALHTGALASAILWYEVAVQQDLERPDGWELLGLSRAENEQEEPAMICLRECVRLQSDRASAYQALAVSYTNELRYTEAYDALEAALRSNPKYSGIPIAAKPVDTAASATPFAAMHRERHGAVREAYFQAAMLSPEAIDADVQIGLGVLFNINHEYDKAVDCFRAALQVKPDDSNLWNKLGATLANSDRSAEAVEAYARALEIRPGYIRARYNLGISCINLKSYRDAAEHFLTALSLQKLATEGSTQRNMSDTIWTSLRTTLSMANMPQLLRHATARDLEAFREHFKF